MHISLTRALQGFLKVNTFLFFLFLYKDLTRRNNFFEGCSWFKFNNLGLALGMALKCYTSVAKGLKLKVRTFWWLFVEVTKEKLVGGRFDPYPEWG